MAFDDLLEIVQAYETAIGANCFTPGETNPRAPGLIAAKETKNMNNTSFAEMLIALSWVIFPVAMTIAAVMIQRFKTQERLRAIEKGIPLPPGNSRPALNPWEFAANFRLAGIICVAVGLGLLVLFTSLAETLPELPKGVIAISAIPFLVGLGLLIEYRMRRNEIAARERS
jgi:hypothetical protein